MTRFDRYMLSQFMVMFGFFALVLVSIFWLNKAVRMFDRLIGDGQPAWVFLEFTALTLPGVIGVILPIAVFASTVYVVNRLSSESELTVVQATGYSPFRLMRPAVAFGLLIALIMSLLVHYLVPMSLGQLRVRQNEVERNISAKLLNEGEFLHPAPGITFFIREITPEGELRDVFLSDLRDPENPMTYTSTKAYLVRNDEGTQFVMVNGLAQNLRGPAQLLYVTHFSDLSYDISSLMNKDGLSIPRIDYTTTLDLIRNTQEVQKATGESFGAVMSELHGRFNRSLLCLVAAMVGFSALLVGGYSRFGALRQILLAFGLLVLIKVLEGIVLAPVLNDGSLWPLLYIPTALGIVAVFVMLSLASHPGVLGRVIRRFRSSGRAAGEAV